MSRLDWFGRRCLAYPAALAGMVLTAIAGGLLWFAAWMIDVEWEDLA